MPLKNATGNLTMLRVHDLGTKFGPQSDQIDVEVVFQLRGHDGSLGFQLRNDQNRPAREGMLNLLRDAFKQGSTVHTDFNIASGKKNGIAIRVWLTQPATRPTSQPGRGPLVVGPVVSP